MRVSYASVKRELDEIRVRMEQSKNNGLLKYVTG